MWEARQAPNKASNWNELASPLTKTSLSLNLFDDGQ